MGRQRLESLGAAEAKFMVHLWSTWPSQALLKLPSAAIRVAWFQ